MGRDGKFAVSGYACVSVGGILLLLAGMSTNVRAAKRSSNSHNFHASAIFRAGDIQNGEVVGHPATKTLPSATTAQDPGARASSGDAGSPLASLSSYELEYFQDGLARFMELDSVAGQAPGEPGSGLGPTFNSNSCGSCHSQPAMGGSSPATNPLLNVATDYGAKNEVPSFLTVDGPVREVRFPFVVTPGGSLTHTPDGGVHDLFTIAGRSDAPNCSMAQPDFAQMQQLRNIAFRIPTPVFGAGLIEQPERGALF